jgi:ApaG protein
LGLTPEIQPGEKFKYFSNVMLRSGMGSMQGSYSFRNILTQETFESDIPKFDLVSEVMCN